MHRPGARPRRAAMRGEGRGGRGCEEHGEQRESVLDRISGTRDSRMRNVRKCGQAPLVNQWAGFLTGGGAPGTTDTPLCPPSTNQMEVLKSIIRQQHVPCRPMETASEAVRDGSE
ncbi:unnamed protein product [Coregonus sp. 'balchen']|nr:unnamed protein product [Coregonus sp. 'balchen']